MFITNLLRGLRDEGAPRIRSRRRPGRCQRLMGNASRRYSRALRVEGLEDRMLLTAYVVDTPLDDPSVGDVTDGLVSLREAITAANTNAPFGDAPAGESGGVVDQITFHESLTGQTIILGGVEFAVSDHLTIIGLAADNLTISGDNVSRVFSIDADVNVDISDVTIADGSALNGGGIYNNGVLTITNGTLAGNTAEDLGGGIYNNGVLTIANSTLAGNTSENLGGGIFNDRAFITVTGSTLCENSAKYDGGGIFGVQCQASITHSTVSANSARGGGGIAVIYGTLTLTHSTVSANSAHRGGRGGGILIGRSTATITGTTVSGNSASLIGGGIRNDQSRLRLSNSTISGNSSDGQGGGIANSALLEITNTTISLNRADTDGDGSGSGGGLYHDSRYPSPVLNNTIVAGNLTGPVGSERPDEVSGDATDCLVGTYNLIGDAATSGGLSDGVDGNIVGDGVGGTIDVTTVLDPNLTDNGGPTLTHALVAGSLAINAGDNSKAVDVDGNPLVYDQRGESEEGEGFARIVDGTVDIGAFEVQPQTLSVEIDVKPGSDPNSINLASNGLIAVAIFTTDDFDASQVDAGTVVFAGASAVHSAMEDVDGDGDLDMVLHFRVQETNLADLYAQLLADDIDEDGILDSNRQSAAVSLTGQTDADECFAGFDDVDLFLSGRNLRAFLEDLAAAGTI